MKILGINGSPRKSWNTAKFEDYSKYVAPAFSPEDKAKRRKEIFPKDCEKAFDMGARFAG